jgi:hypothetical protein
MICVRCQKPLEGRAWMDAASCPSCDSSSLGLPPWLEASPALDCSSCEPEPEPSEARPDVPPEPENLPSDPCIYWG